VWCRVGACVGYDGDDAEGEGGLGDWSTREGLYDSQLGSHGHSHRAPQARDGH